MIILKRFLLLLIVFAGITSCHNSTSQKPLAKRTAEYKFDAPKGWAVERIPFPIVFAPQIPYKGFEDLRFTPGWEYTTSDEHWSYTFLWWLEGKVDVDSSVLKQHLDDYYFGLLSQNVSKRSIPANKVFRPVATITKIKTDSGDTKTYQGTIKMLDYLDLTFPALMLNCVIHKKDCNAHTAFIFEISPQPFGHTVWKQLNELNASFKCSSTE